MQATFDVRIAALAVAMVGYAKLSQRLAHLSLHYELDDSALRN